MKVCCGKVLAAVVLGGLVIAGSSRDAAAQSTFDSTSPLPRSQQVDDLLRQLIEIERSQNLRATDPLLNPLGPVEPVNPAALPRVTQPTQEILAARRMLSDVTRDADALAAALNAEMARNPQVRVYMSDVLKLRARVAILAQRSNEVNDHNLILADMQALDRDWRLIANQITQTYGLDRRTLQYVADISAKAKQLGDQLAIKPQLDRRELLRKTATLNADFSNLVEDLEIELARSPDRNQLVMDARRIQQQIGMLSVIIETQSDYNGILTEYKRFQDMWYPYAAKLRPYQNRYLDRDVRRISETDSSLQQLFWLPQRLDRTRLLYLSDGLKRSVDEFFVRTPLKLLIDLPNTNAVLPTAHEFYGTCSHFTDCVNDGDDHQELITAFRYIEAAQQSFSATFRPLNSQAALQVLSQIEEGVNALRGALGTQQGGSTFDQRRATELAASLEILGEHIDIDMKRWLNRYRTSFAPQALQESAAFASATRRMHENLMRGNASQAQLQRDSAALFESWRRLYGYVVQCNTEDKAHLQAIAARITPALIELHTLLAPSSTTY